jgi:hypothetical protein
VAFVRKRGKSWYAHWDQYDRDGKRIPKALSFGRDKRGAEDFVLLKNADKIRGVQEPSQETFRSFWKRYEAEKLPRLTEKVQYMYRSMAMKLLVPFFGSKPLGSIRRSDIPKWIAWASEQAGSGSVRKAFTVLAAGKE